MRVNPKLEYVTRLIYGFETFPPSCELSPSKMALDFTEEQRGHKSVGIERQDQIGLKLQCLEESSDE
jgi:hypothetical protein